MKAAVVAGLVLVAGSAQAGTCPRVSVSMVPSDGLQIVAWLEDAAGTYVDTIYITQKTGMFGLGNRPGAFGVKSGPGWPYGKRLDVFPIWSHRHGIAFPELVFQSIPDLAINSTFVDSSRENFYCRPLLSTEPMWDAGSCATTRFTDKGADSGRTTGYPPRSDLVHTSADDPIVDELAAMNPFDAISRATPPGNAPFAFGWFVPRDLPAGTYVLRVEVSKEFDKNASYNDSTFVIPQYPFEDYGLPYRGQPSVVYDVPFAIGAADATASTATYAGYGDPDALDGNVRAPDGTIDTGVPGSGAARLLLAADAEPYRVRVQYEHAVEVPPPGAAANLAASVDGAKATIAFTPPSTPVARYEIRYRVGPIDDTSFDSAIIVDGQPTVVGGVATFVIDGLQPRMNYSVGIRGIDGCEQPGPLVALAFETERTSGEVSGCCGTSGRGNVPLAFVVGALLLRRRISRARAA